MKMVISTQMPTRDSHGRGDSPSSWSHGYHSASCPASSVFTVTTHKMAAAAETALRGVNTGTFRSPRLSGYHLCCAPNLPTVEADAESSRWKYSMVTGWLYWTSSIMAGGGEGRWYLTRWGRHNLSMDLTSLPTDLPAQQFVNMQTLVGLGRCCTQCCMFSKWSCLPQSQRAQIWKPEARGRSFYHYT